MGLIALFSSLATYNAFAAVLRVGPGKPFKTVRAAAQSVQDGDTVEIDSGVYPRDVATWKGNNVTVRGVGEGRAHMRADGANEGSKGIWVIQGANVTVENIEFSGAAVADRNGAGIRAESTGTLVVRNCYFHDNENGILGPNDTNAEVVIESSIFEHNGFGDGYSHNMYIGRIKNFRLQCSYSHQARVGHNVKSRARQNYILYSRIMDEDAGTASYEVDLPEGGLSFLIGNIIQKGRNAQNSSVIAYAAENVNSGILELYAVNNTIVNERPGGGVFLQLRPGTKVSVVNNILSGPGTPWSTEGVTLTTDHNYIEPSTNNSPRLADPKSFDYHLQPDSPCRDAGIPPGTINGYDLTPQLQYVDNAQCMRRAAVGALDIGAFEYQPVPSDRVFFPHLVIGGGFSTVFTILNVGATAAAGNLILTDESGSPLSVRPADTAPGAVLGSAGQRANASVSSFALSIPAGATSIIVARAPDAGDSVRKGWARIESSGGSLWGSATFRLGEAGAVQTAVGVLGSQPTEFATIPVDNDDAQSRYVGFAVANPEINDINITITTLDENGRILDTVNPADLNPLGPQRQVARFLHEVLASRSKFRGSIALWAKSGQKFIIVALMQNQGRYTAIPVVPAKAP
jgi:hypothetical protein